MALKVVKVTLCTPHKNPIFKGKFLSNSAFCPGFIHSKVYCSSPTENVSRSMVVRKLTIGALIIRSQRQTCTNSAVQSVVHWHLWISAFNYCHNSRWINAIKISTTVKLYVCFMNMMSVQMCNILVFAGKGGDALNGYDFYTFSFRETWIAPSTGDIFSQQ